MSEKREQKEMQPVEDVEAFLQEVEARANKATPGPWFDSRYHDDQLGPHIEGLDERPVAFCSLGAKEHSENGAFIANARADIPRLVAIVREQATEIAALKTARGFVDEQAWKISEERDALRDRLAKLEADATQNQRAVIAERDNLLAVLGRLHRAYVQHRKADTALTVAAAYMADPSGVDLTRAEIELRHSQAQDEHDSSLASLRCVLSDELSIFRDDGFPTRLQSIEQAWHEEIDKRKAAEKERDQLQERLAKLEQDVAALDNNLT